MNVFVTGAFGYIGSVIAEKLLQAEHQVVGLARSEAAAQTLEKQGNKPYYGDLNTPEIRTTVARAVDGVIHTGFAMSMREFLAANAAEGNAVEALIAGLAGRYKHHILIQISKTVTRASSWSEIA